MPQAFGRAGGLFPDASHAHLSVLATPVKVRRGIVFVELGSMPFVARLIFVLFHGLSRKLPEDPFVALAISTSKTAESDGQ